MNKKLIAIGAIAIVAIAAIALLLYNQSAPADTPQDVPDYTLTIHDFALYDALDTITAQELYDGGQELITYNNVPDDGLQYLLVAITIDLPSGGGVNLDDLHTTLGDADYIRTTEDSFLTNHNYTTLRHGDLVVSATGWVLFEVPTTVTQDMLLAEGTLAIGLGVATPFTLSTAQNSNLIEQTHYYNYAEKQQDLEAGYLATIAAGAYTPEDPFIIVNPYGTAPLSAMVVFETDAPATITTTIHGKGDGEAYALTTLTNTTQTTATYHEIPLIGLYPGANTVDITVDDGGSTQTYTYDIQTQEDVSTKAGTTDITVVQEDLTQVSDGLYILKDNARTLLDAAGDIRGYFSFTASTDWVEEVTDEGHIFLTVGDGTCRTVLEIDYMGYVYREIAIANVYTDHDGYLIDETTLLTRDNVLDLETMTLSPYQRDWSEIFNQDHGSFEVRSYGDSEDWLHLNTIEYGGDGYILVSMRNQHAVAKLSYPELEVIWILSGTEDACLNDQDSYLTPIGDDFEWFYSQHHISLVSENDDGTIDVTLFDNGTQRGTDPDGDYPSDDYYSRMVRYRIDEEAMTVEQVWDFGAELGHDALSSINGSTQYIPESNTYLGSFNTYSISSYDAFTIPKTGEIMTILEVNENKDIVLEWYLDTPVYRIEKVSSDCLYSPRALMGTITGQYAYIGDDIATADDSLVYQDAPAAYQIHTVSATQDYLQLTGWVGIDGSLGVTLDNRQLILRNQITGQSYIYDLANSYSQTVHANIPEDLAGSIHYTAGFSQDLLNIAFLEDGDYSLTLVATQGDSLYAVETEYTLRIGEPSTLATSTDLIAQQTATAQTLLATYQAGTYTLESPWVVLDPYGTAPLSALIAFDTTEPGTVSVTIPGKDDYTALTHDFDTLETTHMVPIYGLYADTANAVTVTFTAQSGAVTTQTIAIQTDALPDDFIDPTVSIVNTSLMADGFTYGVQTTGCVYGFDAYGDIRWYTTIPVATMPIKRLENGNLISGSNTMVEGESTAASLFEFDMLGRIHNEYLIYGAHHEVVEMPNGDLLVAASIGDTVEDYVVQLDRTTGEIVKDWDFHDILDMEYYSDEIWQYHVYNNQVFNNPNKTEEALWKTTLTRSANDWFHNNALYYIEEENAIMASGRMKDSIVKFDADTGEVIWILTDPNTEWAQTYADKILTPVGDDFEYSYGQHAITMADNGDILLFDNGNYRSKDPDEVLSATDSYSRAVRYSVDEETMTVEQVWQYGKELGNAAYSSYISDVDYLDTDHYLINFGGILIDLETGISYNSTALLKGPDAIDPQAITRIVEVKDDKVVYDATLTAGNATANTYRIERMTPYYDGEGYVDLTLVPQRLGTLAPTATVDDVYVPTADTGDVSYTINAIEDSGEDVYINVSTDSFPDAKQYIVLKSEGTTLVYDGNSVIKYGLENGTYSMGLLVVDADGTSHYANLHHHFTVAF